ncbi:Bifunctional protein HldE [termite gut metagenome]|uniref:D-glycero-beta-D-manno-heptose 1-phosphate adenylyltransferase n=1 Tax=termite gut metagenome TaxID=433724 RepID=A0A5J4SY90_9ZZZZ
MMDLKKIKQAKVLVIGDVMVDTYHIGRVKRISPEAPIPIVQVGKTYSVPGGAANVARNLVELGCETYVVGIIGKDYNGELLKKMFMDLHIESSLIQTKYPTTTKTRIIGNNQQIVRIDFEQEKVVLESELNELIQMIEKKILSFDIVVISDYGKGLCNDMICKNVISLSRKYEKRVIVDPKGGNWDKYSNATIITPNLKELSEVFGIEIENEDSLIYTAGEKIIKDYNIDNLLVTRSEKGMTLIYDSGNKHKDIKTEAKEVYDVSGAGDTVIATLAVSLAACFTLFDAIALSNKAASIVVSKIGTSPVLYSELEECISLHTKRKLISNSQLQKLVNNWQKNNKKIVFTNGCFDIIHKGHVCYLQAAKSLGDVLVVGLNSDMSVKRLKGEQRPVNKEEDRIIVLEAFECVDYIVLFSDDTPYNLLREIRPDVLVKGGDYKIEDVVGREFAQETIILDYQEGYSSSNVINHLRK